MTDRLMLLDTDSLQICKDYLATADAQGKQILLPVDALDRIGVPPTAMLPDCFDLFIPCRNETRRAFVAWRAGATIGLGFAQYTQDYDEKFPPNFANNDGDAGATWTGVAIIFSLGTHR